jgi:prenyl protein peptidase
VLSRVQGPLTEEFVFRSCMVPLLVCANFSVKQIVLGSPLMFGVGAWLSPQHA